MPSDFKTMTQVTVTKEHWEDCKHHIPRSSLTEEDELVLNILSRKIQVHSTATNQCRVTMLPIFKEDQRSTRRPRANSTVRERFQQWLRSPEGRAWHAERVHLHEWRTVLRRYV